ncbi:MAG: hypothetical protein JWR75_992 [Devosia sp.]|nr:hypothetical protein [Devosia sp.]
MAFRILLLVNAVATLAAGLVLFLLPGAIPGTVGIELAPGQEFVAWLLGASELGISALCFAALRARHAETLRLVALTLIVFHAASAVADALALAQAASVGVALNLALRLVMVVAFAALARRLDAPSRERH